jgi:sugar phosphate isomerase/epimerase
MTHDLQPTTHDPQEHQLMQNTFMPGAIGLNDLSIPAMTRLAADAGFDSVHVGIIEAQAYAAEHGEGALAACFAETGIAPASMSLPVNWRDDTAFAADLALLPERAALASRLGCRRAATFIMPASNEMALEEHRAFAVERLRAVAGVLADHDIRLGLEFCGPASFRTQFVHPFLWRMRDVLDLGRDVGTGNVGLLLDAWHIFSGGDDPADLSGVRPEEAVIVHINDVPAGLALDELQDLSRAMPFETGVIDLAGFMRALAALRYDGPVTTEPFSARMDALAAADPLAASREVAEATRKAIALAQA